MAGRCESAALYGEPIRDVNIRNRLLLPTSKKVFKMPIPGYLLGAGINQRTFQGTTHVK
jgi:hypothetical protein